MRDFRRGPETISGHKQKKKGFCESIWHLLDEIKVLGAAGVGADGRQGAREEEGTERELSGASVWRANLEGHLRRPQRQQVGPAVSTPARTALSPAWPGLTTHQSCPLCPDLSSGGQLPLLKKTSDPGKSPTALAKRRSPTVEGFGEGLGTESLTVLW